MSAPPSPAKTVDKEKSEESMTLPPKAIEVWSRVAATVANDDNENGECRQERNERCEGCKVGGMKSTISPSYSSNHNITQ